MTMDLEPRDDGKTRITFGPAEKIVAAAVLAIVSGLLWRFYDGVTSKLDAVVVQQAVTNQRLSDLTIQMADLPALKLEVAKHSVQIEQLTQTTQELRQVKGLK